MYNSVSLINKKPLPILWHVASSKFIHYPNMNYVNFNFIIEIFSKLELILKGKQKSRWKIKKKQADFPENL